MPLKSPPTYSRHVIISSSTVVPTKKHSCRHLSENIRCRLTLQIAGPKAKGLARYFEATNLQDKLLIDVAFSDAGLEVGILQETQEKLIDQLQV